MNNRNMNTNHDCKKVVDSIANKIDALVDKKTEQIKKETKDPEIIKKRIARVKRRNTEMLQSIEEHCKTIYDYEVERENNILQQACNMQSAFSFITAGLFVIAQIVTDQISDNSALSYKQIFFCFAIITIWMLLSLIFATLAQSRFSRLQRKTVYHYIQYADKHFNRLQNINIRILHSISEYEGLHSSLKRINTIRVLFVKFSMWSFYGAVIQGIYYGIGMAIIDKLQ